MRCTACNTENAAARRFCGGCGAALSIVCNCGFTNDPAARFCGGCGVRLDAAPASSSSTPEPGPERRQVTVLFVDLVGYTRLTHELGAEETRALLDLFFETADEIVVRFGGSVSQHIGDCVMALFGAPLARGDDPERALRAAVTIRDAVPAASARIGRELAVHAGIAFGEVVAGGTGSAAHRSYTVTGESVNLAARLTDLAGPGEILVSDSIRLALAERIELEVLGAQPVKGVAEPVPLFRVRGVAVTGSEPSGELVGRRAELDQLLALLADTAASRNGRVVLLRGEPGIGKTRLLAELRRLAPGQGFACHTALVLDFGAGEGHDPLSTLARQLADRDAPPALPPDLEPFLLDLLGQDLPPASRAVLDVLDESQRRAARQDVMAALLAQHAAAQPVVLVVEDLHWADPGTLDDLAALAHAVSTLPAALLLSTRRDGDPIDAAWHARAGMPSLTTIDLVPLRDADARQMASRLLVGTLDETLDRCVERAQGNPLFLEQLLRYAREQRDERVPGTVQSLVQARLDRLEPADRAAIRAASVLGQRFTLPALTFLLGRSDYDPSNLVRRFLIRRLGDFYLFGHALIRDAVYDSLLQSQCRELHKAAAAWFSARDPILHAQHLDRAGDPAASAAYAQAAESQARAYRSEAALELAERGLELASQAADRFRLACLVGQIRLDLGRADEALAAYQAALDLARDDAERCEVWLGLASAMRLRDRITEALTLLDQAEAAALRTDDADRLARTHHLRGNLLFPLGRIAECAREHELALAAAERTGTPELLAQALGGVGDAAYARGRYGTALLSFQRCVDLAAQHGHGRIEVANRSMIAICRLFVGSTDEAEAEALRAIESATRIGRHRRAEIIARHAAALACTWQLRLDEAESHIARAEELTEAIGALRFRAENWVFRAETLRLAGRREKAAELARAALADIQTTAPGYLGAAVAGFVAASARDRAELHAALEAGERLLAGTSLRHNHFFLFAGAIEGLLETGNWDEADHYADRLSQTFAKERLVYVELLVACAKVLAAWGRGERSNTLPDRIAGLVQQARALGQLWLVPRLEAAIA